MKAFFTITGSIVPKARPRFNGHRATLAPHYRKWKEQAIEQLITQKDDKLSIFPLPRAGVYVNFEGKHHRGCDADNSVGSILDALVQSDILTNDNLNYVIPLIVSLNWHKAPPITQIWLITDIPSYLPFHHIHFGEESPH